MLPYLCHFKKLLKLFLWQTQTLLFQVEDVCWSLAGFPRNIFFWRHLWWEVRGIGSGFIEMCYYCYSSPGSGFYVNIVMYIFWTVEWLDRLENCVKNPEKSYIVLVKLLYFNYFLASVHSSQTFLLHNPEVCTFLFCILICIVQKPLFLFYKLKKHFEAVFEYQEFISISVISFVSGCEISSKLTAHFSPDMDYLDTSRDSNWSSIVQRKRTWKRL